MNGDSSTEYDPRLRVYGCGKVNEPPLGSETVRLVWWQPPFRERDLEPAVTVVVGFPSPQMNSVDGIRRMRR